LRPSLATDSGAIGVRGAHGACSARPARRSAASPPRSFDAKTGKYEPHPRDWLKHAIYTHLKSLAGGAG